MSKTGKVLLVTGPAGSGKSTLARHVSKERGWKCVSEDDYWVKNDWGSGFRAPEQEKIVQSQVFSDMLAWSKAGDNVVLEFILYKGPPNPLTAYQELLNEHSIGFHTIVLKPSVEEILRRIKARGRPSDLNDMAGRRNDAKSQIQCLATTYIRPEWVIDPGGMSVEQLSRKMSGIIGD